MNPTQDKPTPETDSLRALGPNWDSYEAVPITDAALAVAEAIERNFRFVPLTDGGFQVEFHSGGIDLELAFDPEGMFEGVYVEKANRS